jgi:hypothetical protein
MTRFESFERRAEPVSTPARTNLIETVDALARR